MDMIGHTSDAVAFAIGISGHGGEVGVKGRPDRHSEHGFAVFGAEDHMDEKK